MWRFGTGGEINGATNAFGDGIMFYIKDIAVANGHKNSTSGGQNEACNGSKTESNTIKMTENLISIIPVNFDEQME
jgi:hypothetical protein